MPPERHAIELHLPDATLRGSQIGTGPLLILLHGSPGCPDYLAGTDFEAWLAERYTVVTYDQRGASRSPSNGPFSIQVGVADLDAMRARIGAGRVTLVGHSSGAVLATHYAAAHPQSVERLILLSPAGIRPGWRAAFDATLRERFTQDQRAGIDRIDAAIRTEPDAARRAALYLERFNVVLPAYVDPAHRGRAPRLVEFNREANVRVNGSLAELTRSRDWESMLAGFASPVAVIHGRSDPISWTVVDDYCEVFPHARVFPLDGVGHFPWLEDEAALRAAVDAALADPAG